MSWSQRSVFRRTGGFFRIAAQEPRTRLRRCVRDSSRRVRPSRAGRPGDGHPHLGSPARSRPSSRAAEILDRRVGPGWEGLPADAGRAGLRVEGLVRQAPCGFDPDAGARRRRRSAAAAQLVPAPRTALELLAEEVDRPLRGPGRRPGLLDLGRARRRGRVRHRARLGARRRAGLGTPRRRRRRRPGARRWSAPTCRPPPAPTSASTSGSPTTCGRCPPELLVPRARIGGGRSPATACGGSSAPRAAPERSLGASPRVAREIVEARRRARPARPDPPPARAPPRPPRPRCPHRRRRRDGRARRPCATCSERWRDLHDDERMERLLLADAFREPELLGARPVDPHDPRGLGVRRGRGRGPRRARHRTATPSRRWSDEVERDAAGARRRHRAASSGSCPGRRCEQAVDALVLREHVRRRPGGRTVDVPRSRPRSELGARHEQDHRGGDRGCRRAGCPGSGS